MKKTIIAIVIATCTHSTYAQTNTFPTSGSVGIGTTNPQTNLHVIGSPAASIDGTTNYTGGGLIVQGNTGSRSATLGAQLEFVLPANTDGTNAWGQARIITVAGNALTNDATGKMILGTRRHYNKLGTGITWYYGNDITIDGTGNVGINNIGPLTPLDVKVATNEHIQFAYNTNGNYGGAAGIVCINDANTGYTPLGFYASNYYFGGGNVGIGTTDTKGYAFAVNGTAIATQMTVKLYANWPDYVFKPSYHLMPLTDLKAYIDQKNHLPDVPTAQEIEKDGLNLGEMNKILMKKVEELTLYLIEKDTQLSHQEVITQQQINRLNTQQEEINQLRQQIISITKALSKN